MGILDRDQLRLLDVVASSDPTVDDDASVPYRPGALWLNSTTLTVFVLVDNTVAEAVWSPITPTASGSQRYLIRFSLPTRVLGGGTAYLELGSGVVCSDVGELLPAAATLVGITYSANAADASRTYNVEVISDPTGTPVVLGSLNIDNEVSDKRRDLAAAIGDGVLIGVRIVRDLGTGSSNFTRVSVLVEVSIP